MDAGASHLGNAKIVGDTAPQMLQLCDATHFAALGGFGDGVVERCDDKLRKVFGDFFAVDERLDDGSQGKVSRVIHAHSIAQSATPNTEAA